MWDNAVGTPISPNDVHIGLGAARRDVDEGLYRSRWERATPAQRDLLLALAELGGPDAASIAALAVRMSKSRTSGLSVARNELIKKGLVYSPKRGMLAFTVPGMHIFVLQQDADSFSNKTPTRTDPLIAANAARHRPVPDPTCRPAHPVCRTPQIAASSRSVQAVMRWNGCSASDEVDGHHGSKPVPTGHYPLVEVLVDIHVLVKDAHHVDQIISTGAKSVMERV